MSVKNKVLIIDDDTVFCRLLEKGLARLGYVPHSAHSAGQALGMIFRPDAILLDMRLGEESGLSLIPELLQAFPEARIIMVTAYASLATAVRAVKLGASNYIAKPVDVNAIHTIIQKSLFDGESDPLASSPVPGQSPSLKRLEWEHIHRVLEENAGNISRTAQQLGMHRRTLQRKLKKHAP